MKIQGYAVVAKFASENKIFTQVFYDWNIAKVRLMAKNNNLTIIKCSKKRYSFNVLPSQISDNVKDFMRKELTKNQ